MATEKPKWFKPLSAWRKENNLTSPEWVMYSEAMAKQTLVFCLAFFVTGIAYGYLFLR